MVAAVASAAAPWEVGNHPRRNTLEGGASWDLASLAVYCPMDRDEVGRTSCPYGDQGVLDAFEGRVDHGRADKTLAAYQSAFQADIPEVDNPCIDHHPKAAVFAGEILVRTALAGLEGMPQPAPSAVLLVLSFSLSIPL